MSENIIRRHPGSIIRKSIEALNMSSREFSYRTGISERLLSDIINEKGTVTFDIAQKLAAFFGSSVQVWINLQTQYNISLSQKVYRKDIEKDYTYIKPILDYLKMVITINKNDDKETIVKNVRSTVKVNRLSSLAGDSSFVSLKEVHGFSSTHNFERNLWLSLSLTLARENITQEYDKKKLVSYFDEIRSMTTQEPKSFYLRLKNILGECGVSFVLLPYLSNSNVYGATKWISGDKVMLAMSNRGNRADVFWFTFFHEIAHVFLEHKRYMLCSMDDVEDFEADEFAKNILIPPDSWAEFISKRDFSEKSIVAFAKRINILPYIVLGRLHKENYLEYGLLDKKLSVSYETCYLSGLSMGLLK